jgi:acyl carrier protein
MSARQRSVGIDRVAAAAWIAEVLGVPPETIAETTRRQDLDAWDSLGQLLLIAGLDEHFNIRLADEEISALKSVADVLAVLRREHLLTD